MAQLFNITHDANNLDEYDSTVTDEGDLSTGTPGLASTTAKMEALIDDTNAIYGEVTISAALEDCRVRFYVDPNTLSIGSGDDIVIVEIDGAIEDDLADIVLLYDGVNYEVWLIGLDDGGGWHTGTKTDISDTEHYIEFHVVRATNATSNDGTMDWWIDGAHIEQLTNIDNYDQMGNVQFVRMGAVRSIPATASGTLHLDELKGNDDGSEIGPVVPPILKGFAYVF